MRRVMRVFMLAAAIAVVSAPTQAAAEGFFNPWAGVVFGNDAAEKKFGSFGVAVGDAGHIVGFEANLGYAPDFFDETIDNNVLDLMGNLLIGPMVGDAGYGVRPYVVGGLGLIRRSIEDFGENDLGYNVGAGIMGYFTNHVGLRADVRYFRNLNSDDIEDFDVDLGTFHFWRAQIGLTIH